MTISAINSSMSYTSPNFKGAPKLNASNVVRATSVLTDNANPGALKRFRAKWNEGYGNVVEKAIVKPILAPIMNSEGFGKLVEKTKNVKDMAAHMSTAGSVVTTATYAYTSIKTLNKTEEQKKRAKTLALNQVMVTGLSTLGAYTINGWLANKTKQLGYKFREVNQGNPKLSTYMKGFDIAKSLLVFSIMYRYIAPVVVTPIASKIGNYIFNKDSKKPEQKTASTVVPPEAVKLMAMTEQKPAEVKELDKTTASAEQK